MAARISRRTSSKCPPTRRSSASRTASARPSSRMTSRTQRESGARGVLDLVGSAAERGSFRLGMTKENLAENRPEQPGEVGHRVDDEVIDSEHPDDPFPFDEG